MKKISTDIFEDESINIIRLHMNLKFQFIINIISLILKTYLYVILV